MRSRSGQWGALRDEFRSAGGYAVPEWLFDDSHRVDDQAAYLVGPDGALTPKRGVAIRRGAVVVLLESPHKDEFAGPGGRAIGPLRNTRVRKDFEAKAPALLRAAAAATGVDPSGRQLVLANAVQYQTSLHALMRDWGSALQDAVRNCVWKAVFRAGGGDEMIRRLDGYAPHLVLLAPTTTVRKPLLAKVREAERRWPSCRVSNHPSGWWSAPPRIVEQVTGLEVPNSWTARR